MYLYKERIHTSLPKTKREHLKKVCIETLSGRVVDKEGTNLVIGTESIETEAKNKNKRK